MRHELARISAALWGDYPVSDDYKLWREDKAFLSDYRRLCPDNVFSRDRKWTLREMMHFTRDVPGDLAECGCYEGASAFFMAQSAPDTSMFLFDSFDGLSQPGQADLVNDRDVQQWRRGDRGG